jgi:hypothetical protein
MLPGQCALAGPGPMWGRSWRPLRIELDPWTATPHLLVEYEPPPSFGWATTSMMPSGGARRIDRRLMYQRVCKVHPREFITAILHKPRPMGG